METNQSVQIVGQVLLIPCRQIRPFPGQPRTDIDPEELQALADSIKESGQKQIAIVRVLDPPENGILYELIAGERRWRACQLAEVPYLKAIIDEPTETCSQFEASVLENANRVNLTVLENAAAIHRLSTVHKKTHQQILVIYGKKSPQWVTQHLRILSLDPKVLKLLGRETPEDKRLLLATAYHLIDLPPKEQIGLAEMASEMGMSAEQVKHMALNQKANNGIKTKNRSSEEFKSVKNFFRKTKIKIDLLVDNSDARISKLFEGRTVVEQQELMREVKDCYEDLDLALDALQAEFEKRNNPK